MKPLSGYFRIVALLYAIFSLAFFSIRCSEENDPAPEPQQEVSREGSIPDDAVKMTPETDAWPPEMHNPGWEQPVPMEGPVNTAGAEDAPVISSGGKKFLFFFTPDVDVPPEQQVLDGVTGIWWCTKTDTGWEEPKRVLLCDNGELALDGPLCINGNTLWFCSVRSGNYREIDIYTAELQNGSWKNWTNAGSVLNAEYLVGELYVTDDGSKMFFDSYRQDGYGGKDIWLTENTGGEWTVPVNSGSAVNSEQDEGWLWCAGDGNELWFTRWSGLGYSGPAIFRTTRGPDGNWNEPEEIISNFAGDPAVDADGNIYFTHHFYTDDMEMIEADIYVAYHANSGSVFDK